jgi:hypothetical protein
LTDIAILLKKYKSARSNISEDFAQLIDKINLTYEFDNLDMKNTRNELIPIASKKWKHFSLKIRFQKCETNFTTMQEVRDDKTLLEQIYLSKPSLLLFNL